MRSIVFTAAVGVASSTGFCETVNISLPGFCTCTDLPKGGKLSCDASLGGFGMTIEDINLGIDVEPCNAAGAQVYFNFDVQVPSIHEHFGGEATYSNVMDLTNYTATIPIVGSAAPRITVKAALTADHLTATIDVDVCGKILRKSQCLSDTGLPLPVGLPLHVLDIDASLGSFCQSLQTLV